MKRFFLTTALIFVAISVLPSFASAATLSKPQNKLGLVGYWPFNEGTGTVAHDFSGNGDTGTLTNSPTWTSGKLSGSVSLNGTSQYVALGDNEFNSQTTGTMSAWIYLNQLPSSGSFYTVLSSAGSTAVNNLLVLDVYNNSGTTVLRIGARLNLNYVLGSTGLTAGKWYHVTVTSNGSSWALYVNGVLQTLTVQAGSNSGEWFASQVSGTMHYDIGALVRSGGTVGYLPGKIDEARVYSRALSATEVAALYTAGSVQLGASNTQVKSGLVGWWTFDGSDISGTTATDKSGSGNDGTLGGSPSLGIGKIGQALAFDGTQDWVSVPDAQSWAGSGKSFSIATWVKTQDSVSSNEAFVTNYPTTSQTPFFMLGVDGTNSFFWVRNTSSASSKATGSYAAVEDGRWHHLVGVRDASTNYTYFYIDGVLAGSAGGAGGDVSSGTSFAFMRHASTRYTQGSLDDVRVYDRALSADEVKQIYGEGGTKIESSARTLAHGSTLSDGLTAHWTFDGVDTTATTALDSSGNGYTADFRGNTSKTIGKLGQALSFDGTGDYLSIENLNYASASIPATTVCAWAKSSVATNQIIISFDRSESWRLALDDDSGTGNVGWDTTASGNGTDDLGSPLSYTDGKWHFICGWYDGSANPNKKLYIDSQLIASTNAHSGASLGNTTRYGFIGDGSEAGTFDGTTGPNSYMNGSIDDVRIYNRGLSDSEITQLYNLGH